MSVFYGSKRIDRFFCGNNLVTKFYNPCTGEAEDQEIDINNISLFTPRPVFYNRQGSIKRYLDINLGNGKITVFRNIEGLPENAGVTHIASNYIFERSFNLYKTKFFGNRSVASFVGNFYPGKGTSLQNVEYVDKVSGGFHIAGEGFIPAGQRTTGIPYDSGLWFLNESSLELTFKAVFHTRNEQNIVGRVGNITGLSRLRVILDSHGDSGGIEQGLYSVNQNTGLLTKISDDYNVQTNSPIIRGNIFSSRNLSDTNLFSWLGNNIYRYISNSQGFGSSVLLNTNIPGLFGQSGFLENIIGVTYIP